MIRIAVAKGRIEEDFNKLFKESGFDVSTIENKKRALLIRTCDDIEVCYVKAVDVVNLVEQGFVDLGIVGNDTVAESSFRRDIRDLLNLQVGKCYFALAGRPGVQKSDIRRVASKYPNIAGAYFRRENLEVEIEEMQGSLELAPIIGYADAIVDIVETGETLKANGLVVLDRIAGVSTRVVSTDRVIENKAEELDRVLNPLRAAVERKNQAVKDMEL